MKTRFSLIDVMIVAVGCLIIGHLVCRLQHKPIRIDGAGFIIKPGTTVDWGGHRIEWWNTVTSQPEQDVNPAPRE